MIKQFKNSSVEYNPETGEFRWVVCHRKPWMEGKIATHEMPNGYLYIKVDGKQHSASRLAVELITGKPVPPELEVDHDNRKRFDNIYTNLIVMTVQKNRERSQHYPGQTGVLGVSIYNRPSGNGFLYRARKGNAVTYHETIDEAIAGYAKLGAEACDD